MIDVSDQEMTIDFLPPTVKVLLPWVLPKNVPDILKPVPASPLLGVTDLMTGLLAPHPTTTTINDTRTMQIAATWLLFIPSI